MQETWIGYHPADAWNANTRESSAIAQLSTGSTCNCLYFCLDHSICLCTRVEPQQADTRLSRLDHGGVLYDRTATPSSPSDLTPFPASPYGVLHMHLGDGTRAAPYWLYPVACIHHLTHSPPLGRGEARCLPLANLAADMIQHTRYLEERP